MRATGTSAWVSISFYDRAWGENVIGDDGGICPVGGWRGVGDDNSYGR